MPLGDLARREPVVADSSGGGWRETKGGQQVVIANVARLGNEAAD